MHISSVHLVNPKEVQNTPYLLSGQSVSGKVIKDLGNGSYLVRTQGSVIKAKSDLRLFEGQAFKAILDVSSSKVLLKIIQDKPVIQNQNINLLLQKLNLESSPETAKLLNLMVQSGVKIDSEKIKGALKQGGQKNMLLKDTDEASLLMDIKGLGDKVREVFGKEQNL